MAPSSSSTDDLIHNVLSKETGQSSFACNHCRRQKVKCDRILPQCANCTKSSRTCEYPLTVQKPGPKAGSHRRPRPADSSTWRHSTQLDSEGHVAKQQRTAVTRSKPVTGARERVQPRASIDNSDLQNAGNRQGSITTNSTSQSPRTAASKDNRFLSMLLPSHEPEGNSASTYDGTMDEDGASTRRFDQSCRRLGCSALQGKALIQIFFSHMTSLSLFHHPTFDQKLRTITSVRQLQALLSAIFAFALRHKEGIAALEDVVFSAQSMLEISTQIQHECIEELEDDDPPLHLLQSFFLVTFQKLIHGVRGKTWRMMGDCVRMAYELRLNMIDAIEDDSRSDVYHTTDSQGWIRDEERRRLWWSIWEMDIFTSTIRRLPNAIDERLNLTFLPVSNDDWYAGNEVQSCFLVWDASQRWRKVRDCGNKSPQTWFILINSYMYDAHKMVAFPNQWASRIGFNASDATRGSLISQIRNHLEDCLQCAHSALPEELNAQGRSLAFNSGEDAGVSRALDTARYCIHIMTQLARLMLSVWEVHKIAAMEPATHGDSMMTKTGDSFSNDPQHQGGGYPPRSEMQIWEVYVDAANSTADMIRNSSTNHYQFVNPLISNAIWYAAAAMVVVKLFGPARFNTRLAASNFDHLLSTLNKYEEFWGTPSILKYQMKNLEDKFAQLKHHPEEKSAEQSPHPAGVANDQQTSRSDVTAPTPIPSVPYSGNQITSMAGSEPMAAMYTDFSQPNWTMFNFGDIPAFGSGQPDLLQANIFDMPFVDNTGYAMNDNVNFSDLFMYPYQ